MASERSAFLDTLQCISSQFFEMTPVRKMKWKDEDAALLLTSPLLQVELLNATVRHPVCQTYPPALSYRRYFMKMLIHKLESQDADVADEVYECYTDLLSCQEDDEETLCYKSYLMPNGEYVSLQESVHLVSQGTTGLSTWQAAQHLAEWILENPHIVSDRTVTELGCGLGFTGIAVCKCCVVKKYSFTDCHNKVLSLLSQNIQHNFSPELDRDRSSPKLTCLEKSNCNSCSNEKSISISNPPDLLTDCDKIISHEEDFIQPSDQPINLSSQRWQVDNCSDGIASLICDPRIQLCSLDWERLNQDHLYQLRADVILAADVVFDLSIIPSLVSVLKQLLTPWPGCAHNPKAFIASTIRNEDTRDAFLIAMASEGLSYAVVESPNTQQFFYDRSVPIEILEFFIS